MLTLDEARKLARDFAPAKVNEVASLLLSVQHETAERCAQIASELEDDDRTAGAVWQEIRTRYRLQAPRENA